MKFKAIFFLFNAIILLSLGFILILPVLLLDWEYTRMFWAANWYLAAVFAAFFLGVNWYFLRYWSLYRLLEQEDWSGLQQYLHTEIFDRRHFRYQYVRLYIHTAIVLSRPEAILTLEEQLRAESPRMHRRFALLLGIPYLLRSQHEEMAAYYRDQCDRVSGSQHTWVRWCYGFALFLQKRLADAAPELTAVLNHTRNSLLQLASLYMLGMCPGDQVPPDLREREACLRRRFSRQRMLAVIDRKSDNILVLILDQFIRDAVEWLYQGPGAEEHRSD
ncbi:hypothetical protein [Spirochaeta africana]|uniref:Uncharacterized protein n=1 Tax=Spirochaeta africana (strain ATCC 700263 / DSM 8902 / Z-7692) TaxID=889378 RepID=H9UKD4_SPIAZ|nr:hypothetical protein [Spirochaeta africana]AFG37977.1 hypothetical protein Spiaf_1926 [Spirochaeta africana DSM 8902]